MALRYRLAGRGYALAPELGYALASFVTGDPTGDAPDVKYDLVRAGFDGRWSPLSRVALLARASYLHVLSAGPLTAPGRFARAQARGMEAEAGLAFDLLATMELHALVGLRRFGIDMLARPGDRLVAGGAADQTTWLGMGITYRGQ